MKWNRIFSYWPYVLITAALVSFAYMWWMGLR